MKEIDRNQLYDYHPHGGESVRDVGKRQWNILNFIKENYSGKTIIAITSAGFLRLLFYHYPEMGIDFREEIKPGEYFILEI